MKKTILLTALAAIALSSCNKTTNNTTVLAPQPSFTVNGLHDVTLVNNTSTTTYLPITVQYGDSAQEVVTLSVSGLPANVIMDTTWVSSGIPTYTTDLSLSDTTAAGATPGTYPITVTATGASSGASRSYTFKLKIKPQPPCTTYIIGKYATCNYFCGSSTTFTDSVYADPTVLNKIWFTNFNNSGAMVYGNYICNTETLIIPSQVAGGITYSGNGSAYGGPGSHQITLNLVSSGSSCTLEMQ